MARDQHTVQQKYEALQETLRLTVRRVEENESVLKRFFDMELKLLACNTLGELLDVLFNQFREKFRLQAVSLHLLDPEGITRDLLANIPPHLKRDLTLTEKTEYFQTIYPAKAMIAGEIDSDSCKDLFPHHRYIMSAALLPLIRQHCIIGSLHLGAQEPDRYTKDYRYDYLTHLSSVISVCIENCISQETLHRLSTIDALTGVHNRRAFGKDLTREMNRANRSKEPLSCLLLDIDHFKSINDTHGHQTGDRTLKTIGALLLEHFRNTDLIARYGGEEFAVLLPACPTDQAKRIAEELRLAVAKLIIRTPLGDAFRITTSIGCSTFTSPNDRFLDATTLQQKSDYLISQADAALYDAKRSGRNQVKTFKTSPLSSTAPAED
jgi:two-component system cell cycle response regulator